MFAVQTFQWLQTAATYGAYNSGFQIDSDQQSLAGDKHDKFFKLLLDIRGNS